MENKPTVGGMPSYKRGMVLEKLIDRAKSPQELATMFAKTLQRLTADYEKGFPPNQEQLRTRIEHKIALDAIGDSLSFPNMGKGDDFVLRKEKVEESKLLVGLYKSALDATCTLERMFMQEAGMPAIMSEFSENNGTGHVAYEFIMAVCCAAETIGQNALMGDGISLEWLEEFIDIVILESDDETISDRAMQLVDMMVDFGILRPVFNVKDGSNIDDNEIIRQLASGNSAYVKEHMDEIEVTMSLTNAAINYVALFNLFRAEYEKMAKNHWLLVTKPKMKKTKA